VRSSAHFLMGAYLVFTSWGLLVGWGTIASRILSHVPKFRHLFSPEDSGEQADPRALSLIKLHGCGGRGDNLGVHANVVCHGAFRFVLPQQLTDLHERYKTPSTPFPFSPGYGGIRHWMGLWIGPDQEFFLMGTVLTLALAVIYSLGNLGYFSFTERTTPGVSSALHALFPLISSVALLWWHTRSVVPLPARAHSYAPAIVAGCSWLGFSC